MKTKLIPGTPSSKPALKAFSAATVTLALAAGGVFAADDKTQAPHNAAPPASATGAQHKNLAEAATNPLSNLMQFQFQYQYNWKHHNTDDTSMSGVFQPVIPFKLPSKAVPQLITRFTVPYETTPKVDGPTVNLPGQGVTQLPGLDSQSAFGDIVGFGLFMPKLKTKGHQIGIGPAVSLPLSSNEETGSGKWALGPAVVYVNTVTPSIQWGALAYQLWDIADSQTDRQSVNKAFIQPFVTKHFKKGWYVGTQDTLWSYDWRTKEWNLPIGPQVGRVFKIGKQPVKLYTEVLYQPENNGVAAEWSAKIGLTLLLPK